MSAEEGKVKLLLVDDRPENLLALEAIIEREDIHLVKATSGEEALKYLLKFEFAAILLDVQMPGIDGFGTAKIIKTREKTKNTPILFITANNMDTEHIFTGYSLGAIDYLLKPFDPIILKAKVEGFVALYKMNQTLIQQSKMLEEKTKELEQAYNELSQITRDLRISEALANVISHTSLDSMIVLDRSGFILKVNPAVQGMFHYSESEMLGEKLGLLFNDASQNAVHHMLETVSNFDMDYEQRVELSAARKDSTSFPVDMQMGRQFVSGQWIIACTIRDLTKQKEYEQQMKHMAYHDGLTLLPNRRFFNERLTETLDKAKTRNDTFALLYLDIDRFKYINDSLGHAMGDRLLQNIAKRILHSVREDDFVARIGGDEFNIILPHTHRESALEHAERLIQAFKKAIDLDSYELYVTASVGVAVFPYDGEEAHTLMQHADAALYRAKEHGKNQYKVYHSGMNIQTYKSFILQNDLRKAVEREEFSLVYQPRMDLESGEVTSAEALIRWNHPNWGLIYPLEFISLAEETGQIVEIGEWVIRQVCAQQSAWLEAGLPPIRIAVNFSPQQFMQKHLVASIEEILGEYKISPEALEIEVTESMIMGYEGSITNTLKQIRQMGIWISIDDFGTGYSSLNYLRRFPVHTLKIDKSFIQDMSNSAYDSTALVSTIITLAHSLNMTVIAEGVETQSQLDQLKALGCNELQGFLFSPPVSVEEFEGLLIKCTSRLKSNPKSKNITYLDTRLELKQKEAAAKEFEDSQLHQSEDIMNAALLRTKEQHAISSREMDVFELIVKGYNNKEISDKLFISEHTVKNHITHILQKLQVSDRIQAMAKVYKACIDEGRNQTQVR